MRYCVVVGFPLLNNKILNQSKLNDFADDKRDASQKRTENVVGKGENAGY